MGRKLTLILQQDYKWEPNFKKKFLKVPENWGTDPINYRWVLFHSVFPDLKKKKNIFFLPFFFEWALKYLGTSLFGTYLLERTEISIVTRLETLFPVLDYFVFFMEPKLDCFTAITSKMKEIFTITKSRTIKEKIKIAVFYFDEL